MYRARKEALLEECTRLLSERGYDAMTLDQVAEAAGMAKAVLYKHFKGKEELCCEVMVRGLERAQQFVQALPTRMVAYQKLLSFVRWVLQAQLTSDAPLMAERKSEIRMALQLFPSYQEALQQLGSVLEGWVVQAQHAGHIHPDWPPLVVRQLVLSRTVDPMVDALRLTGVYTQEEVVEWCVRICMTTLQTAPLQLQAPRIRAANKEKTAASS